MDMAAETVDVTLTESITYSNLISAPKLRFLVLILIKVWEPTYHVKVTSVGP